MLADLESANLWMATFSFGEGNGNPLQYSCLENPIDRGACWVIVHGVAKSQAWLKWLNTHLLIGHKEGWMLKNWCFQIVVLKKTLESPLDCKDIKWVNPKVNQPWIFIRRTEIEAPILWPPDVKNWPNEKDPYAGKDWRQEEKGTTEEEIVR